jgi:hypothetical protein
MLQVDKDLQETASRPRPQGRRLRIAGLIALAVAVAATATGLLVRWRHEAAVKHWTITEAVPTVSFVIPRPDSEASRLILPGDIRHGSMRPSMHGSRRGARPTPATRASAS